MQNRCQSPQDEATMEFTGEVRLSVWNEEGKRLKGAPAAFVGESTRAGPASRRRSGLLLANCAHRLSWHPSSLELWSLRDPRRRERGNSSALDRAGLVDTLWNSRPPHLAFCFSSYFIPKETLKNFSRRCNHTVYSMCLHGISQQAWSTRAHLHITLCSLRTEELHFDVWTSLTQVHCNSNCY